MKDLRNRLERLIDLATSDTVTVRLKNGQTAEVIEADLLDVLVEALTATREHRNICETEVLEIAKEAERGQSPLIDLVQVLLESLERYQQDQIEVEH